MPETVRDEVERKSRSDERFRDAGRVLNKLPAHLMEILSDAENPGLRDAIFALCQTTQYERMRSPKDLGETMVVSHAFAAAKAGRDAIVLIDDQGGQRLVADAARILDHQRIKDGRIGTLRYVTTEIVLRRSIKSGTIQDRGQLRSLYAQLRTLDDGLVSIEQTSLLDRKLWTN